VAGSEYDPLFAEPLAAAEDDLEPVRERFRAASRPFLRSPLPWLAWAIVLPGVALATPAAARRGGPAGVLLAWSLAILGGGAVEALAIWRAGGGVAARTPLAGWVLRIQGNLSLVALALSALLLWQGLPGALPGLWLLLLGHSFYVIGSLSSPALRACGIIFQVGGAAALWPGWDPLPVFAITTGAGALWLALGILRARATERGNPASTRRPRSLK